MTPLLALPAWAKHLLLFALAAVTLVPGTGALPLMDRDEPKFAQATWEMMERGEWFVPYFNDGYRFDKPVLTYWWMRIHFNLFGKTEFAARLHSMLATWLTAVVIQAIGAYLYSARAGWGAAAAWLLCLQVMVHGRLCVADMPLLLGITLSMLAMFRLLIPKKDPPRFGAWFWVLCAGQILGFLAKGPLAFVVPLFAVLLARFAFYRQPLAWRRLQPLPLLGISFAAVAAWGLPAMLKTDWAYWDVGIGEHVVERGAGAFNGRAVVPGYYFVTGLISLLPWTAFLPATLARSTRDRTGGPLKFALLAGWFVAPFLIFTPYATQLPHYVLPGFPAFFLLLMRSGSIPAPRNAVRWVNLGLRWLAGIMAAASLVAAIFGAKFGIPPAFQAAATLAPLAVAGILVGLSCSWFWTAVGMFLLPALAALPVICSLPWKEDLVPLRTMLAMGALIVASVALMALPLRYAGIRWAVLPLLAVGALAAHSLATAVREMHPVIAMQPLIRGEVPAQAWQYTEPSLVFYSQRGWTFSRKRTRFLPEEISVFLVRDWRLESQIESLLATGKPRKEADQDFSERIEETRAKLGPHEVHVFRGFNVARTAWVEVMVCVPSGGGG